MWIVLSGLVKEDAVMGGIVRNSTSISIALCIVLGGLKMEGVMVELTILSSVDLNGEVVRNSTPSIPTVMWTILSRLEMEDVMVELTTLLSADLTVASAWIESTECASLTYHK